MLFLSLGLLVVPVVLAQSFEYATRFPKNKLYSLEPTTIGLAIDGTIAAFGDLDGDKFADVFVISADQSSVSVYTWHHDTFTFTPPKQVSQLYTKDIKITTIVPGDYNYDGKLDVLVMGQKDPTQSDGEIVLRIYTGNGNGTLDPNYITLPSARGPLPMVLDISGDMKPDLLGYAWNSKTDTNSLAMWINTTEQPPKSNASYYNVTSASTVLDRTSTDQCHWAHPHSNAFLDLDGDCLADLVLVCEAKNHQQQVQFWTHQRDNGFQLAHTLSLPIGAGALSFADIDGDGAMDMVFPVCHGKTCQIHIAYNQQMGLCSDKNHNRQCREARNLCIADPNFTFDFDPLGKNYVVFDINVYLDPQESIRLEDTLFHGKLPVFVHPGDYNLDGYPDLLVTTTQRVLLLESVACTVETCTAETTAMVRRTFSPVTTGVSELSEIQNPTQAAFFDIDENGSLDILVLESTGKKDASRIPRFVINNFFNDAFFLKGLVSNGVCPSYCPTEPVFPNTKPYGVSYPGATFKFTVLDTSGVKRVHQVSQLSQSSYLPLQTPYCLFGLGRTNNYVEEMFAGITRHQHHNYLFYEGVIPNSQLIFIPYQPEEVYDSSTWKVELYIQPADHVPWVLATLIAAALALAVVVVFLYWTEKREDEMERRKALHIINFDAL
ncbi:hypothetical protein BDF14DRAFT_1812406 [Spinellus fusiger]|nr:hypothetical protein BDF14DRAFT_1812406 [Spinellus fusiger]